MTDFEHRVSAAQQNRDSARSTLSMAINRVGMTAENRWNTVNQQQQLMGHIDIYVKAEARVAVLEILKSEDFYIAMSRSAAAVGE